MFPRWYRELARIIDELLDRWQRRKQARQQKDEWTIDIKPVIDPALREPSECVDTVRLPNGCEVRFTRKQDPPG